MQSIIHKNKDSLFTEVDEILINKSLQGTRFKRFAIGKKINAADFKLLIMLRDLLCTDKCGLKNQEDKIKEKLNLEIINLK